ncbi:hypothetical protein GCM10020000_21630 [Streptomyces olivoverticillatus]
MPGRGLTAEKLHFLGGLPRIDGATGGGEDLSEATADFVKASAEGWPGPHAPRVRMLPALLSVRELPGGNAEPGRGVAIGLDEMNLAPVFVDFDSDPLFAVYGESESGKTALLRLLIKQLTERYTPEEALFCVGDYRRGLLECVPEPHLVGYATTKNALEPYLADMNTLITSRIPGPDVTPQQLRRPQLVERAAGLHHRRRLRSGGHLVRQPDGSARRQPAVRAGRWGQRHPGPQQCGRQPLLLRAVHPAVQGAGRPRRRALRRPGRRRAAGQREGAQAAPGARCVRLPQAGGASLVQAGWVPTD